MDSRCSVSVADPRDLSCLLVFGLALNTELVDPGLSLGHLPWGLAKLLLGEQKSKWPPFLGRGKFFENCRVHSLDTLWIENFDEIALSHTVKEIEANSCFAIFGKNLKIQNGRHFWGGENFLKIAKSKILRYPVGRKVRRNRSISHG